VRGHWDLVTVVGTAPTITPGEYLEGTGWWVTDRTHGLQFKTTQLRVVPPTTLEGIERYLGSGNASFATWVDEAAKTARQAPQTIVHGDFHGGNHLFNPHDACRVIDLQFFGTGRVADEVAYFFTMSFDPAPEAEEELLHLYHHALVEAGVHDYPYAQFLHEYHVSTLTLLLGSLVRATTFLTPSAYDKLAQKRGRL
jgi:hypothetical protein